MILIHVQQITSRVSYTFKHICKRILGVDVDFTSKIESFVAYDGPKFSYGKHPLGKELYFQSVDLLFEHGFNEVEIHVYPWEETKCFFKVQHPESGLPFDIFAASFYLLTRYEEYLPHIKDGLGRFIATESIAYSYDFLKDPVVDIWAYKFKNVLLHKYPGLFFEERSFKVLPIISVSQTFAFWQKGILRTLGGIFRDIWKLKFNEVTTRIQVLIGLRKDPYDTFDFVINLQKERKRDCSVLFGLGDYSQYEKNILYNNPEHKKTIKHVSDYLRVGLKVSYDTINNQTGIKEEKGRIESIINRPLTHVLCAFYKIKLPEVYRSFIELEIQEDYSMGFPAHSGFRAGTCSPFLFYDLDYEVQTPLKVYSFCLTPQSFTSPESQTKVKEEIIFYMEKVKQVHGTFIPVFSNGLFSNLNPQSFWRSIFEFIWNSDDESK